MSLESRVFPSSLHAILETADNGFFTTAAQACTTVEHGEALPAELFRALGDFDATPALLDDYLLAQATQSGARRVFSTWAMPRGQEWLAHLTQEGNGTARSGPGIELVTLGAQKISLQYSNLPAGGSYAVHFLASFPSNVGDNFYLALEGSSSSESIRFSNSNVSLVNDSAVFACNARVQKLYSLVINGTSARLYVNGVLEKCKQRPGNRAFDRMVVRLLGDPGPDLGGYIHGIELQHTSAAVLSPFGEEQALFAARAAELIESGDASKVYHLLNGVDEKWLPGIEERILALLDIQLTKHGVQEWIYDTLLSWVSPERAARWTKEHAGALPTPILSVSHLTAQFMLTPNKRFALSSLVKRSGRERFLVLDDVNFDVFPGDIVGIVGANGAGKSTLLKAVAGLLPIHKGEIILRSHHLLLSAGLGARNELTGRENIYLAGTFMGLSKAQLDKLFDEIWEFSELGSAIDKPFKYYSDGMKGRLVFSLATSISPDLLMLDELLSAGDIKFQKKAADRMSQLIDRAKAVIVVTHSIPFVAQRCNKAVLISGGKMKAYGDPQEVISHYLNVLHMGDANSGTDFNSLDMNLQLQTPAGGFNLGA
ncbi:MAG TPA: ATP-binding cassette domain-containing protein [Nitrospira sp.]|nr:ATP-binding cassette domain-containing protein [Nitrospira sp.]